METKSNKRVSPVGGTVRIFARSVQDVTANKTNRTISSISSPSKSNENSPNKDQECINDCVESSSNPFAELYHGQTVDSKEITLSQTPTTSKTLNSTISENSQSSRRSIISQLNKNTEIDEKEKCTTIKVTLKTIVHNDQIDPHVNPQLESKHLKPISVPKKKNFNKELSTHESKSTEKRGHLPIVLTNDTSHDKPKNPQKVKVKNKVSKNNSNPKDKVKTKSPIHGNIENSKPRIPNYPRRSSTSSNNSNECSKDIRISNRKSCGFHEGSLKDKQTYTRKGSFKGNSTYARNTTYPRWVQNKVKSEGENWNLELMEIVPVPGKDPIRTEFHKTEMLALSSGEGSVEKIDEDKLKALNCANTQSIKIRSVSESDININSDATNFTTSQAQNSALDDWSEKAGESGSLKTLNCEDSQSIRVRSASESGIIINSDTTDFTTSQDKTQNSAPENWSEKAGESGFLKTLNCEDIQSIKIRSVSESDINLNNDTGRFKDLNQDKIKNVAPEDWFEKADELRPSESLQNEDTQSIKVRSVGKSSNFTSHEDKTQNSSQENWSKKRDELGSVTVLNCDATTTTLNHQSLNQDSIHNSTPSDLSKQADFPDSIKTLDTEGSQKFFQPSQNQSKSECTKNGHSTPNDLSKQADVPVAIKTLDTEGSQEFFPPSQYKSQTEHTMNDNSICFTEKKTCSNKDNTPCSNSASEDWSKEIIADLGQPSSFDPFPDKNGNVPAENDRITELEPDNCNLSKPIVNVNDNSDQSLINIEVTDDNLNDNVKGATDSDSVIYLQECEPPENRKLRPIHARGGIQPPTSCRRKAYSVSDDDGKIKPHPLSVYFDEDWCKLQLEAKKETENPNTETQNTHVLDGNVESRFSQDYRKNQFIKEQQPTVDIVQVSPTKPFSPQSSTLKRGSRNQKEDSKFLPIRTDKSIDEKLKKLDESFGFRRPKSHSISDKRQDYQRNKFKPRNIHNNRSKFDSEDWTSELLEVPAISSTKIKDDSQVWPKNDTCMETYITVDDFDNRNDDISEQYEINKNKKASLHVHQKENKKIGDSCLIYCEDKKPYKVSNIVNSASLSSSVHDSAALSSSAYNSESSVAIHSERKHEKERIVIDDASHVKARSKPSKCSSPLKRKDAKMLSSNIDISNIVISDDISDYSSIVSDNDVDKFVQTSHKTFKIPDSDDIEHCSQRHCVSSDSRSPKDKMRKQYSPERTAAVMSTCSSSTELNKHSSDYSPSRQPSRDSGFYGKHGPAPEHCDYNFYQHGKPPVFDPRMFNPYLQAPGNWMPFYPYNYMCPPYYPCEYDLSLAQNPPKEERENHPNKKPEIIPQETENKTQDARKIKSEDHENDKLDRKEDKPEMDLCSLITVPLSEISDIEQAKNLLHYVKNSVSRITDATGFYYKASLEHDVPVLHVGATTNKKNSLSEQKTKPCRSHSSDIGREKEKHKRRQTRRNSSTSLDARCTGNRNNKSNFYSLSQSPDSGRTVEFLSSPPSTYHYQPRYPIPESLLHHGSPPKSQSYTGQPRFQHQGFTLPDFDSYDSSRNYRNNCDMYMNQDSTKMNEVRSLNSSIVSYDLTDEDDSYDEDGGFNSQKFIREVKQVLDSDGDVTEFDPHRKVKSTECGSAYNEEFPELSKQSGKSKPQVDHRFVEKKGKRRICEPLSDKQFQKENNPVTCRQSDLQNVIQSINSRYVPPHKRRFSEDSESYSRSFTKFGQFNDINPNSSRQSWENNSRRSSDQCAGGDVRDRSPNLLNRNWSRNLVAADGLSTSSNRYECKSDPYAKPTFQADKGRYQQNFDTKTFVNSFYGQHDRRSSESNSSSSYSSRLQYDNRLRSNTGVLTSANWKFRLNQRCQYYKSTFIDTHCHLDFLFERLEYNGSYKDFKEKYSDSFPQNFEGCISIFCNPKSFKHSGLWMEFAEEENVWMAMGCHPKHASSFDPIAEENLKYIINHPKIIAVGEIGLDYSSYHGKFEAIQKVVFTRQLKLCLGVKKPLVIHCRDAEDDCLKIMEEIIPKNYKIHCHCFTGSYEQAKRWLEMFPNLYLGITPVVTYSSATASHDLARKIPLNRLLLETDSPYFVPRNLNKDEHKVSLPGFAIVVAEEVARYQDITVEQVLIHCRQNTKTLFGI
ncbi:uncharacterized protein LOC126827308 [Patella vulgata]|uniref:uncharacterized protein LOC126827308 n=1 Tax=Patella vulgata TaxID=6465 RepID=UPI0024A973A2|nr:uncharacterized protein LOC126827308 [Patella vulgata]